MDEGTTILGRNMRARRFELNYMTLEKLAERTGLSETHLSRIENGRVSPNLSTIERIAKGLETTSAELMKEGVPHVERPESSV